jgi:hypothetical protein
MMNSRNTLWVALYLCSVSFVACDSKTPVPFKRGASNATGADTKPERTIEAPAEASTYPDGTQKIRVGDTLLERAGAIRASWAHDVNHDGQPDVLLITTDAQGHASLETVLHGTVEPTALPLAPYSTASLCRAVSGSLVGLGDDQALATVDFLCDQVEPIAPSQIPTLAVAVAAEPIAPAVAVNAAPNPPAAQDPVLALPPPEPSAALAQTHYFVVGADVRPRIMLHLTAEPGSDTGLPAMTLTIDGSDLDGDEHADVRVMAQLASATTGGSEIAPIALFWLSRSSGLARDRQEPERSIQALSQEAWRLTDSNPQQSLTLAANALRLHRVLCREGGIAKLWVDDARGLPCGASLAAGKAVAATTVAHAKQQALLPALEARSSLDDAAYQLDAKTRTAVAKAIAAIRGDTHYRWQVGPALNAPNSPAVRLPALGFIDEQHLLLRGPIAQSYDLLAHTITPIGIPGSVHAVDPTGTFAIVDIARTCDGYHLHIVPAAQVIGGIVTGASISEPLLQAAATDPGTCSPTGLPKTDHGGYSLLGLFPGGALFARGTTLQTVSIDEHGRSNGQGHILSPGEQAPKVQAPGALDASTRYFAVTTTEGIALVDRTAPATSKLVRTPASCNAGPVSDPALSPSGHKIAMLCGGHVYVAEPAADGGLQDRP